MSIDSIARVASQQPAQQSSTISLDDFLKIFLAQLQFQDPLEPVDNSQFLAQLAQFTAVEIANDTNQNISSLLDVSSVSQVVGLLGRTVQISNSANSGAGTVGTVSAISFNNGDPLLTIKSTTATLVDIRPSDVNLIQ